MKTLKELREQAILDADAAARAQAKPSGRDWEDPTPQTKPKWQKDLRAPRHEQIAYQEVRKTAQAVASVTKRRSG